MKIFIKLFVPVQQQKIINHSSHKSAGVTVDVGTSPRRRKTSVNPALNRAVIDRDAYSGLRLTMNGLKMKLSLGRRLFNEFADPDPGTS